MKHLALLLTVFAVAGLVLAGCDHKCDEDHDHSAHSKNGEVKDTPKGAPKDTSNDGKKDPFAGFGIGTTWTTKSVTAMTGMPPMETITKSTLMKKTKDKVTIEMETQTMGQTVKTTSEIPLLPEAGVAEGPKPKILNKGSESITVPAGTFKCEWIEVELENPQGKGTVKTWTCDEVPQGVVKSVMKMEGAMAMETVTELTSLEKK
jgi:hypothetical protein